MTLLGLAGRFVPCGKACGAVGREVRVHEDREGIVRVLPDRVVDESRKPKIRCGVARSCLCAITPDRCLLLASTRTCCPIALCTAVNSTCRRLMSCSSSRMIVNPARRHVASATKCFFGSGRNGWGGLRGVTRGIRGALEA